MPRIGHNAPRSVRLLATLVAVIAPWAIANAQPAAPASKPAPPAVELKLPPNILYARSLGPESTVVFRHETHVAMAENRCTGCHPRPFRMLTPSHRTSHAEMEAGGSCGICHDGKHAFGTRDRASCASCHSGSATTSLAAAGAATGSAPARVLPKPIVYARAESPGPVRFRHETHVRADVNCATCHPKRFAMKALSPPPADGMHSVTACGGCHDGKKAFGVENSDACERCHKSSGSSR